MVISDVTYNCCEQWMMACKARLFNDEEIERQIMECNNPAKQKSLGQRVSNFDSGQWDAIAEDVVYFGNLAKFAQRRDLATELLATNDMVLVEASPMDKRWGIGLAPDHPDVNDPKKWKGENWLGIAIMRVRDELRASEGL